jgi:hypothetical protein
LGQRGSIAKRDTTQDLERPLLKKDGSGWIERNTLSYEPYLETWLLLIKANDYVAWAFKRADWKETLA